MRLSTTEVIKNLGTELEDLKKYSSPEYQIFTRSKKLTKHVTLDFTPKPRQTKMTTATIKIQSEDESLSTTPNLTLEAAIKLIPHCSGPDDVYQFINACDLAVNSIKRVNASILIRYITTRLSGRALESIKYKNTEKWVNIKNYLKEAFESHSSEQTLQLQLNSLKMNFGESVNNYSDRCEKLFYQLCNIHTLKKSDEESEILRKQLSDTTLQSYIKGLIKPIKIMVKPRNPQTFLEAKNLALMEELEHESDKFTQNLFHQHENKRFSNSNNNNYYVNRTFNAPKQSRTNYANNIGNNFNRNSNNRENFQRPSYNRNNFNNTNFSANQNNIRCYICNGSHYASECTRGHSSNYRPPDTRGHNYSDNNNINSNRNNIYRGNNNNFARPPTQFNARNITCSFCKKRGHNIDNCFIKKREERNNFSGNSGNANRNVDFREPRSVNQITAEHELEDVTTSFQQ